MTAEQWKPIPGYPGYLASSGGQIASVVRGANARILKGGVNRKGYRYVGLTVDGKLRSFKVHRLVLEAFHGPRPDGLLGRHLDGNQLNNSIDNLAWGSPRDNNLDTVSHGRHHNARKTHCPKMHPLSGDNVSVSTRRGYTERSCKTCHRDRVRARRAAQKAVAA